MPVQEESQTATPEGGNKETAEEVIQSRELHPSTLPRVNQLTQQDTQLISDVYEATNLPPRRVELHKSQLGRRGN